MGDAVHHQYGAGAFATVDAADPAAFAPFRAQRVGRVEHTGSHGPALSCYLSVNLAIVVRDNNVDQALRALKKQLQREGVYREMKLRRHYEKPSEKRARERAAAVRRARKLERKRAERDGAR
ncbi:hypothetical protein WR25_09999 [Diploscapter pachys]|uniref:30S ribosomal protein S21 n=1 Tax=Diploscapter pachys TaxID=2018661 RepID=A0A2A2KC23_9BILA|nr:hypothetical protein WR25_09999 [Diploscapter pachys]